MSAITLSSYFPCATAPFGHGEHRLWTEQNIKNIFDFILDIKVNAHYCIISADNKKMMFDGYLFQSNTDFANEHEYYIIMNKNNNELYYSSNDDTVLWDSEISLNDFNLEADEYEVVHATSTKIKFVQTSIDKIDLNN